LNLGVVALDSGNFAAAAPVLEDVLAYHRREGIAEGVGFALLNLGQAAYRLGEHDTAREHSDEACRAFGEIGFRAHVGQALQGLAAVEASAENHEDAARLLGRAEALLADVGASAEDFDPSLASEVETKVRTEIGDAAFVEAHEEGSRASTDLVSARASSP